MENFNKIGLKNYSVIAFGGRKFYLPLNAYAVYYQNDVLQIDFSGNNDAYGIVNGIRCYDVIKYDKTTDVVTAWIKEYILDGVQCMGPQRVTFKYEDQKICISERTGQVVTPWRHYEELATEFLLEFPQIDVRISNFLSKHPKCFGNSPERSDLLLNYVNAWLGLHTDLTLIETDPELREHGGRLICPSDLNKEIFELFIKETPGL